MKKNYIDSIRGIAILMVILVHTSQIIENLSRFPKVISMYGQMGVQLFFVASAYTLSLSASNRENESNKIKKYAIRRYFRIAPAYYLGILTYFLIPVGISLFKFGTIVFPIQYSFVNVVSNLLFIHGFYSPANNNIVFGGWSIGTEMAFYAIFPILFELSKKILLSVPKFFLFWVFSSLLISQLLLIIIYQLCNCNLLDSNSFLYYNLVNQFPVFCIGIGYYYLEKNNTIKTSSKLDIILFIVLTIISLIMWKIFIPHLFSFIPFVSALSFIFLIKLFKEVKLLNQPLIIKIGTVSYSMYLVHFIFVSFIAPSFYPKLNSLVGGNLTLIILYVFSVTGSYLLALISEKYIEKPFIDIGRKIIKIIDKT